MALNKNKGVTEILGDNEKKLNNTQQRKQILPKLLYWQIGNKLLKILPGLLLAGGATAGFNYVIKNIHFGIHILDTPTVVTGIKKISELSSSTYVGEMVINDTIVKQRETSKLDVTGFFSKNEILTNEVVEDRLVLVQIATGRVRVGFDLSKVNDGDISVRDSVLYITLPAAKILDVSMNPSDIKPYYEERFGEWSEQQIHDFRTNIYNKAMDRLKASALESGILERAEKNGSEKLKSMYKTFGFKDVSITVKDN